MRLSFALVALLLCLPALGQQTTSDAKLKGPKKRVAVAGMDVKVGGVATTSPTPSGTLTTVTLDIQQPTEFGTGLSDILVTELVGSGLFVVLDRQNFEDILKEKALATGADFDPKAPPKAGRELGAQILVRGSVTELTVKKSGSSVGGAVGETVGFGANRSSAKVTIDLKLVDVATSQILQSVSAEGAVSSHTESFSLSSGDIKLGLANFEGSVLGQAVRRAIKNAVQKIVSATKDVPWEAKVALVSGEGSDSRIYINAGSTTGLKIGDTLTVFAPGEEIVDPDTQVVIGHTKGVLRGKCRVVELQPGLGVLEILEGAGFSRGDVVKTP